MYKQPTQYSTTMATDLQQSPGIPHHAMARSATQMDLLGLDDPIDEPADTLVDTSSSGVVQTLAQDIVRQMDHYFSDANLATDRHLNKLMRKEQNRPVKLSEICSWNNMSYYKFDTVVQAIKDCKMIDVVEDLGEVYVKRKKPFRKDEVPDAPKAVKSKKKATGFEKYHADAPVTPAEYAEEQQLYSLDLPFSERIESALQRYAHKRKFHSTSLNIFNRFMTYGGVDSAMRMFTGGIDKSQFEGLSKADIAMMTATNFLGDDKEPGPDAKWAADFEAVAKGFLSSDVPEHFMFENQAQVTECTNIIRNFYNYLLHHDVCPEYRDNVLAARKVCDLAETELIETYNVIKLLPGNFNKACSKLFDEAQEDDVEEDLSWMGEDAKQFTTPALTREQAKKIFTHGIAQLGDDDDFLDDDEDTQRRHFEQEIIGYEEHVGLEVHEIVHAEPEYVAFHKTKAGLGKGQALGKLICKSWTMPSFEYYDLPEDHVDDRAWRAGDTYDFWVEQETLDQCFLGMKLSADVAVLSTGLLYIDKIHDVRCSFYTLLDNDLLMVTKWKEPVEITREEAAEKDKAKEELRKFHEVTEALPGTVQPLHEERDGKEQKAKKAGMPRPEVELIDMSNFDPKKDDELEELVVEDVD